MAKEEIKEVKETKEEKSDIVFFSEADMIFKDGKKICASEYPLWYNQEIVSEIAEDIRRDEYAIQRGYIKESQLPTVRERLGKAKKKLNEIEESLPKLSDRQKDKIDSTCQYLGNEIREKMFSRNQMVKGLADSHQEANRMVNPSITVTPEVAELAAACNVKVIDGKITRDGASKIWKIGKRVLGDMSDVEELRRD